MSSKQTILSELGRTTLLAIADGESIELSERRSLDPIKTDLARKRSLGLDAILGYLSRDELKAACRVLGLEEAGRSKDELVQRILGSSKDKDASATTEPPSMPTSQSRSPNGKTNTQMTLPLHVDTEVASIHGVRAAQSLSRFGEKVSFIWAVADLLRGDFKAHQYGSVILPLTILRRLDQVLAPSRDKVHEAAKKFKSSPEAVVERMLLRASGQQFYNTSQFDFAKLLAEPNHVAKNLHAYIAGFSQNARDIIERFKFLQLADELESKDLLYLLIQKFNEIDLHPTQVSNLEMGYVFEELIRKFAEQSNETAGEHFTPREVIRLMINLLFVEDDDALRTPGTVRTMLDPACGTGGMLSVAEEYLAELNPDARLQVYGQEINDESYAICKADMLIKGEDANQIYFGNSFSDDGHKGLKVDYLISNPPFGVDWTKAEEVIRKEHEQLGHAGRFGPGLPRKNDGSLLFLLHMLSKMKPADKGGSRLAIVFNGSPLFTGDAGSGESEIRRYLLENDLLEAIVALPDQMFYNTGINTYIWLVTNRKSEERRGKVQLINGVSFFRKMRKSLGEKRKELSPDHIRDLTRLYDSFENGSHVKVFENTDFGYQQITVERPLRLDFQCSAERRAKLEEEAAWANLVTSKKRKDKKGAAAEIEEGQKTQKAIQRILDHLDSSKLYLSRPAFVKALAAAADAEDVKIPAPLQKAILSALSARNEAADVCLDSSGKPEPDPELRDAENVPLKETIAEYLAREVLPHVPDAWVDDAKTRLGYEIPLTRHFYEYVSPRALALIQGEIESLEKDVVAMLSKVFA